MAVDMRRVTFMGMAGLDCLLGLGAYTESQCIALFMENQRRQPVSLLELLERMEGGCGTGGGSPEYATRSIRRSLPAHATRHRKSGAPGARAAAPRSAVFLP
ncbi:hypothetical protein [Streptomyces sp. NPDC002825]|uniref:hypothetical protein n=1 Tax=Streptomyces sp. NPDC002825 TaxID=3154666 RepID=UPI003316C3B0